MVFGRVVDFEVDSKYGKKKVIMYPSSQTLYMITPGTLDRRVLPKPLSIGVYPANFRKIKTDEMETPSILGLFLFLATGRTCEALAYLDYIEHRLGNRD